MLYSFCITSFRDRISAHNTKILPLLISVWISCNVPVLGPQRAKSKEQVLTLSTMTLMTSQSLPPSSASGFMIMSHSINLAGLAHRKNSFSLHCFLIWNSNQSDKISPPYPPSFDSKLVSHPPTDRSGPGLFADTQQDGKPPGFFFSRLHWLEHGRSLATQDFQRRLIKLGKCIGIVY